MAHHQPNLIERQTMRLRVAKSKQYPRIMLQLFHHYEIAYIAFGLNGLCAEIEFPSDWHEYSGAWVKIGLGVFTFAFSFPWPWTSKDEGQCSGHTYGFTFFRDGLHLHWGKSKGRGDDPFTIIQMPWAWRHKQHDILDDMKEYPYKYTLHSGEVQKRIARIREERRIWTRPWIPWKSESRYIEVEFNKEVGEGTGSWKGGVLGCSYEMLKDETPLDALRRMELERKF